jgi:hypothetical protein
MSGWTLLQRQSGSIRDHINFPRLPLLLRHQMLGRANRRRNFDTDIHPRKQTLTDEQKIVLHCITGAGNKGTSTSIASHSNGADPSETARAAPGPRQVQMHCVEAKFGAMADRPRYIAEDHQTADRGRFITPDRASEGDRAARKVEPHQGVQERQREWLTRFLWVVAWWHGAPLRAIFSLVACMSGMTETWGARSTEQRYRALLRIAVYSARRAHRGNLVRRDQGVRPQHGRECAKCAALSCPAAGECGPGPGSWVSTVSRLESFSDPPARHSLAPRRSHRHHLPSCLILFTPHAKPPSSHPHMPSPTWSTDAVSFPPQNSPSRTLWKSCALLSSTVSSRW